MELPRFKGKLAAVGGSKAFIIPAKIRADHNVKDDEEYWIELRLFPVEEVSR